MSDQTRMDVADATAVLREEATDAVGIITMSAIGFWGEPRPHDFRLMGTMGAAAAIGLGVALGLPDRTVWVIDGDGSLLMQLGVVAAVSDAAPPNLLHVVIDNGIYAISGAQPVASTDWPKLLVAAGYSDAVACGTPDDLRQALRRDVAGPRGIVVHCTQERPAYPPGIFLSIRPAEEAARLRGTFGSRETSASPASMRDAPAIRD